MKSLVLFSGGIDSLAALHFAEVDCKERPIPFYLDWEQCPPALAVVSQLAPDFIRQPIVSPWTPTLSGDYLYDRNLLYLTYASIYAKSHSIPRIYTGFVASVLDPPPFYDTTSKFCQILTGLLSMDSVPVTILAPFAETSKEDVAEYCISEGLPFHQTISCDEPDPGKNPCGICLKCWRRGEMFKNLGLEEGGRNELPEVRKV